MIRTTGTTLTRTYSTRDQSGALANPTVASVAVVKGDGTTASPTVAIGSPSTGLNTWSITLDVLGRWTVTESATLGGKTLARPLDVVHVDNAATFAPLIGLDDAKEQLGIPLTETKHDAELAYFVGVASEFIERKTRTWRAATVTEQHTVYGADPILLRQRPAGAVTSVVTSDGVTIDAAAYFLDPVGNMISRTYVGSWLGARRVVVVYALAAPAVPLTIRHGVARAVQHFWTTQRGGSTVRNRQNADDTYDPRYGYSYPRAIQELIDDYATGRLQVA